MRILTVWLAFLLVLCGEASEAQMEGPFEELKPFLWRERIVFVCGGASADAGAQSVESDQIGFYRLKAYAERDTLLLLRRGATGRIVTVVSNPNLTPSSGLDVIRLAPGSTLCEATPSVLLIGLDGRVKQRWDRAVEPEELFALIDAMPMRRREIAREQEGEE